VHPAHDAVSVEIISGSEETAIMVTVAPVAVVADRWTNMTPFSVAARSIVAPATEAFPSESNPKTVNVTKELPSAFKAVTLS
jgi:hypothetical protein